MSNLASWWVRFAPNALLATIIGCHAAEAHADLAVTNYGIDSASCGSTASPCRSISQAIENAASGDTIWVGAGRYGDLSGDGNFDAPGSEHATTFNTGSEYMACAVCVMKSVRLFSYNGAAVTTIQVGPNSISPTTVYIAASNVVFGSPGHGFTITGGNSNGVVVDLATAISAGNLTVAGNIDVKDGTGFLVNGPENPAPVTLGFCQLANPGNPGVCVPSGLVSISANQAIGNGSGFFVQPKLADNVGSMKMLLQNNLAVGAGEGFVVGPGFVQCDDCFDAGDAHVVTIEHNFAVDGGEGFNLLSTGAIQDNVATNNSRDGFSITNVAKFLRNSAVGNGGPGVIVGFLLLQYPIACQAVNAQTVSGNSFWGNDRNRPSLNVVGVTGSSAGPSAHCGVLNVGAVGSSNVVFSCGPGPSPPLTASLQATDNYWGSAKGPQPGGPGDAAGGACDQNGGVTVSKPFATGPASITPLP